MWITSIRQTRPLVGRTALMCRRNYYHGSCTCIVRYEVLAWDGVAAGCRNKLVHSFHESCWETARPALAPSKGKERVLGSENVRKRAKLGYFAENVLGSSIGLDLLASTLSRLSLQWYSNLSHSLPNNDYATCGIRPR